ncbi:MAG: DUF2804 family protein [Aureispira sp.]
MKIQQKKIAAPISNFVFENNTPPYGVYQAHILDTNTNAWDGTKGWLSPRRWQRKAWIFFGAYTADLVVGFAMVDAGYLAKAFCYVYHRQKDQYWEQEYSRPFGFGRDFGGALKEPWKLGPFQIQQQQGQWQLSYHHKKTSLQLRFREEKQGISALCPSDQERPFHYTYKNLLLPTQIYYQQGQELYEQEALGSLDYSKGYPPRHTRWNWTSFMGQLDDGTPIGINSVKGFNQDLENALWLGDNITRLGSMDYHYPSTPLQEAWQMQAQDGQLKVQLQPDGLRQENINLRVLKSQFQQVFGPIKGQLYHQEKWHNFQGYGLMEEHEARW